MICNACFYFASCDPAAHSTIILSWLLHGFLVLSLVLIPTNLYYFFIVFSFICIYLDNGVAIGNPERHARKASHHGSKQQ